MDSVEEADKIIQETSEDINDMLEIDKELSDLHAQTDKLFEIVECLSKINESIQQAKMNLMDAVNNQITFNKLCIQKLDKIDNSENVIEFMKERNEILGSFAGKIEMQKLN